MAEICAAAAPGAERAPRVDRAALHRLSESANGIALWGYVTPHPLKDVLAPGYFDSLAERLVRFDRILITAGSMARRPRHRCLVVEACPPAGGVSVVDLGRGLT